MAEFAFEATKTHAVNGHKNDTANGDDVESRDKRNARIGATVDAVYGRCEKDHKRADMNPTP
jgi:hypothetical protein